MRRQILYIILFVGTSVPFLYGQGTDSVLRSRDKEQIVLENTLDSLKNLCDTMLYSREQRSRFAANQKFIPTLVHLLKTKGSFYIPLDSLKTLSILKPRDNKFRIITWALALNDGTYRFYGTIQYNTKNLKLRPLVDDTPALFRKDKLEKYTLGAKSWYGAKYKQITTVEDGEQTYYVLVGWKGIDFTSTQKVIETLYFDQENEPRFGLDVLEVPKKDDEKPKLSKKQIMEEDAMKNTGPSIDYRPKRIVPKKYQKRVVFEFWQQVNMMLKFEDNKTKLIFDHLAAPGGEQAEGEGVVLLKGPDLTYDAYYLENGKWAFQSNIDLRSPARDDDDKYYFPGHSSNISNNK